MPVQEENFNNPNLVIQTITGSFGAPSTYNTSGDYMVLSVANNNIRESIHSLSSNNSYGNLFSSTNSDTIIYFPQESSAQLPRDISSNYSLNSSFKIYTNPETSQSPSGSIYIKANEILSSKGSRSGNYTIIANFLNQFKPTLSNLELFDSGYYYNSSGDESEEYLATLPFPQYLEEFDTDDDGVITSEDYIEWVSVNRPDIADFIWVSEEGLPSIDGTNLQSYASFGFEKFIITQIAPSRKEVRLELSGVNKIVQNSPIIEQFKEILGDSTSTPQIENEAGNLIDNPNYNPFKYSHLLNSGRHLIPITNYLFDEQANGVNDQSIILRFNQPLPSTFLPFYVVTIEKEILKTQLQNVEYLSEFVELPPLGSLEADSQENWINNSEEETPYQNLNQLSSSLSQEVLDSFVTKSVHDYPNLNTDFNHFGNHTFFGSAKIKLKNFKNKVETIQSYYSDISGSLVPGTSGSITIESSSNTYIQYRNNLFDKIADEINSFTPYEKFLYFDGQGESTASAPGISKNYAATYAMAKNIYSSESEFVGKNDGLPLVYKFSQSLDTIQHTELFRHKYQVEDKPFFNYSSSVYLSFLMKSDQAYGKMTASTAGSEPDGLENRYVEGDLGYITPRDALYQNDILAPSLTGSEYRRCVFQASSSYWQPALTTLGVIPVANNDLNFDADSSDIVILSGSVKTGSHSIEAESDYQNLSTFIPSSGSTSDIPFTGSIAPSGDLFAVRARRGYITQLSASFNIDTATSGSNISESMLQNIEPGPPSTTLTYGTIPSTNQPRVSDGMIAHGRQYGKSMFFITGSSESGVGGFDTDSSTLIRYDGTNVNFSKSGSFSLSIWAKRFHPETTLADQADTDTNASQRLIGRGNYNNAYGIEYRPHTDEIKAKIRSGSASDTEKSAVFVMGDNMTGSFHHIVMTFESGSETGLKLYVDGEMRNTATTLNMHGGVTLDPVNGGDISVIIPEGPSEQLEIGGGGVVGGNSYGFNGYLQYPRVYGTTLTDTEVLKLYENPDGILEGEITDVKVTLNDPSDAQPFSQLYHTSSAAWKTWYNGMYDSASAWDEENVHSLENNLPSYIRESSEYGDLEKFLGLTGEQFDVVRNHIDDMGSLYNRNYKEKDSVPSNTLPIILDNLGWEAINPYTASLATYFGQHESSVMRAEDITNSTWRKTLNNLLYIYKTKGTRNSVESLLNIYGYPSDVIRVNEYGGANESQNDTPFRETASIGTKTNDTDLRRNVGNVQFTSKKAKLYHYRFNKASNRTLQTDWWSDGADANTVEFVYKHRKSDNTQELLISSGSGATSATATIHILTGSTAWHDETVIHISSSDGTGKTYIFDQDNDGATGTLDGDGKVRIQINGLSTEDEIALEVSKSISSVNGHKNKISVSDSSLFLTSTGQTVVTSDGKIFTMDSSGSVFLTQVTASVDGNKTITTTNPSASVSGFGGGSEIQSLWDLTLVPSSSIASGITSSFSSFRFRLNNTKSGSSGDIASNGISMSLDYNKMDEGQLWNVMLQRMSSSVSGSGTQEYRLYSALPHARRPDVIETLSFISMSVSGGLTEDSNNLANQNWPSSGSRIGLTGSNSSNLYIGRTLSGSIAELRTWTTSLSASRFRMHTLNKFSTVGNSIDSHRKELIYRFKLNENYVSSSISSSAQQTINIADSAPKETLTTDYTFTMTSSLALSSSLYGFDMIDAVIIGLQDANQLIENDNKIIINPERKLVSNLNPYKPSVKSLYEPNSRAKRTNSMKIDLNVSPQNYVNNFILEKIQGFNLETLYANPQDLYSSSYSEFDSFSKTFFKNYPISVDINKFIRKHESIFNSAIIDGIKKIVPGRTSLSDKNSSIGVTIKPHILEKPKFQYKKSTLEVNPNLFSGSIFVTSGTTDYQSGFNLTSSYTPYKSASIGINDIVGYSSSLEVAKSASISIKDIINYSSSFQFPKSASISIPNDVITYSSSLEVAKSSSIDNVHKVSYLKTTKDASNAASKVTFIQSASNNSEITLTSWNGSDYTFSTFTYRAMKNSTNGTLSGSLNATASFRFKQSASNNSKITLTSWDGSSLRTRTYMALNSSANGTLSGSTAPKGVILYSTGSGGIFQSQSAAANLAAAITSSNGHGSAFTIRQGAGAEKGLLTITQSGDSHKGNTSVEYADNIHLSFTTSASVFINGDSNVVLFSTGSGGSGSAMNLAAAITSSNGHGTKLTVSRTLGVLTISQSSTGDAGNTSITYNNLMTGSLSGVTSTSSFTGGDVANKTRVITKDELISLSGSELVLPISGPTNEEIAKYNTNSFRDLHAEWGRDSGSVHFLNMSTENQHTSSQALGEYNVNHIEPRYHFYMVGDVEIYSGSKGSGSFNMTEYTNHTRFYNRQMITDGLHGDMTYESHIGSNKGAQTGRAMGKTRYFTTSSDGELILPSNHVRNFNNPWVDRMYAGTQNVKSGYMNPDGDEDYSTASFYRVKVTGGENQIIVRGGKSYKDKNDKII